MWEVRIQHEGLRASRILKGPTQADAQWKATAQLLRWDERWLAQQRNNEARTRLDRRQLTLHGKSIAAALTAEAVRHIAAVESLLNSSLQTGIFFQWDDLKDTCPFVDPPIRSQPRRYPPPQLFKDLYAAELTPLDSLLPARRKRKEREADERYQHDLAAWQVACTITNRLAAIEDNVRRERRQQNLQLHHRAQQEQHAKVEETKAAFKARDKDAIEYFFSEILSRSSYPVGFPEESALQYIRSTRTLIVEYELPSFAVWPANKQVQYVPVRNALHQLPVAEVWARASYQNALFQIALRVISELFTHDDLHALQRIALNGWVRSVDKATGNLLHARLLSVVAPRESFTTINLAQVEPEACFRKLKGLFSKNPIDLLPVHSLMPITQTDDRFSTHPALDAFEDLQNGATDLASMNRSDFETLIRQAFEQEFRKNSSQLRVKQAGYDTNLDTLI
jgi:restriction system protein